LTQNLFEPVNLEDESNLALKPCGVGHLVFPPLGSVIAIGNKGIGARNKQTGTYMRWFAVYSFIFLMSQATC
jgi:hypothetical protein